MGEDGLEKLRRDACSRRAESGDMLICHWDGVDKQFQLYVREPAELAVEQVADVINIRFGQLRGRLNELPRDREIVIFCRSGQRAYYATRILLQKGFRAVNLTWGMLSRVYSSFFLQEKL